MPLLSLLLLLSAVTPPFAAAVSFPNCDRTFSCGQIQNITYPFTGGDRPPYCGPPQFKLTCPNNSTHPELTSDSLTYRVLELNQPRQTLVLARLDLYNSTCPQNFINSTLDSTIFTVSSDNVYLNLIYGCDSASPLTLQSRNVFSCNVNGGGGFSDAYYFVGLVPVFSLIRCTISLMVPILGNAGERLSRNVATLEDALTTGFRVKYRNPFEAQCVNCSSSGGQCGFLDDPHRPICICQNALCGDHEGI